MKIVKMATSYEELFPVDLFNIGIRWTYLLVFTLKFLLFPQSFLNFKL